MPEPTWSWSQLVKQYGEEEAFIRLAHMKGYGQFRHGHADGRSSSTGFFDGLTAPKDFGQGCPICGKPLTGNKGCWQ